MDLGQLRGGLQRFQRLGGGDLPDAVGLGGRAAQGSQLSLTSGAAAAGAAAAGAEERPRRARPACGSVRRRRSRSRSRGRRCSRRRLRTSGVTYGPLSPDSAAGAVAGVPGRCRCRCRRGVGAGAGGGAGGGCDWFGRRRGRGCWGGCRCRGPARRPGCHCRFASVPPTSTTSSVWAVTSNSVPATGEGFRCRPCRWRLQQRLVDGDGVADLAKPVGDGAFGDRLAEGRHHDRGPARAASGSRGGCGGLGAGSGSGPARVRAPQQRGRGLGGRRRAASAASPASPMTANSPPISTRRPRPQRS